jgi:phytoene/squalene synthetase
MGKGITIMEIEDFTKRIEILLEKEEKHLDWLMAKRIQLLNKKFNILDDSVDEMIKTTQNYIDHYSMRLAEYKEYVKAMKHERN